MSKLYFNVQDLNRYDNKGAYSISKYLGKAICKSEEKIFASEGIQIEPSSNEKGGIIVFSTEVNAEKLSDNKLINWFKQKFSSFKNKLLKNRKIDDIANKHNLVGWTIGNFLNSRYTANNGKTSYSEDSLSVEIIGVNIDELIKIAEELCIEFLQESVLLKDYSTGRVMFISADINN